MKLLWIFAVFVVLSVCHKPSKCSKRFHKKIGHLFRKDDCKTKLSQHYAAWEYDNQSASEQDKVVKFLDICAQYEKGTLGSLPPAPPGFEGWEFVNGYWYTVLYLDVYADVTFEGIIEGYLESVACYDDEPEEEDVLTGTETEQKAEACHSTCTYLAKLRNIWDSETYTNDVEATWTYFQENGGWSDDLDAQTIDDQFRMMIPISLYYTFSMQRIVKPKPTFCPEKFYTVFGEVLVSQETRCQLSQVFSDYESKCPNAPKECKSDKFVESVGKCKRGQFTAPTVTCEETKFIDYAAVLVEASVYDEDFSIYDLFDEELSSFSDVPSSSEICESSISQYILMCDVIAEICGMTEWSVYIEFRAEFLVLISTSGMTWEGSGHICEFIIRFFNLCCEYLEETETTVTLEETSTESLDETTTELLEETTESDLESSTSSAYTGEECKSIKKFFKLIAYYLMNASARGRCNWLFKSFLEGNPTAEGSFKAVLFLDSLFAGLSVDIEVDEDDSHFFEFCGYFIIEFFFNSNFEYGVEISKGCDKYSEQIDEVCGSDEVEEEEDVCEELSGPEGCLVFFDICAKECGFFESEWCIDWKIRFTACFEVIDFSCGCLTIDWTVDWCILIEEFFHHCTSSGQSSSTESYEETTEMSIEESTESTEYTDESTEVTDVASDETTVSTIEDCKYQKKFFTLIAFLLSNQKARYRFNKQCKSFVEGNPDAELSFKTSNFVHMAISASIAVEVGDGSDECDEDNYFFEGIVEFVIEFFFKGTVDYGQFISQSCEEYEEEIDTVCGSVTASPEEETSTAAADDCVDLQSPEGIFVFLDVCAHYCGFFHSEWYVEWLITFKSCFATINIEIDWESFTIDWSSECWCSLLLEFLQKCSGTEEASTTVESTTTKCLLESKFFYYIGYIFSSSEVRKQCNGHLKKFKTENPDCSRKERSKAFVDSVGKCAQEEEPEEEDEDDQFFFDFITDFIIDLFLAGDVELHDYIAQICAELESLLPSPATPVEEITVSSSEECPQLSGKEGCMFFLEIIAIQCGFVESEWYINWCSQFTIIFFELDFSCGSCWDDFEIDFAGIDWLVLLLEFFEKMTCGCSGEDTTIAEIETTVAPTEAAPSEFDFFYFFITFCMNAEFKVKLSKFISWYFYSHSVKIQYTSSDVEKEAFYSACFTYMKQCSEGTDAVIDMTGVTYDETYYSEFCTILMYDLCIEGKSFASELCIEFLTTISLPPLTFVPTYPTALGEESIFFVIDFMAKCGGYSTNSNHIEGYQAMETQWDYVVSQGYDSFTLWSQFYMFIQIDVSNACEGVY